jgi:hypothetical protein
MTDIHLALEVSLQADKSGDLAGGYYSHSTNITQRFTFLCKSYVNIRIKKLQPEKLRMCLIA